MFFNRALVHHSHEETPFDRFGPRRRHYYPQVPAFAGNANTPGVDKRQQIQKHRIGQGVRSGELTGRETVGLARQQGRVHRMERRAKSDGHVTGRERLRLHRAENRASRNIYRQKHDRRRRR